MSRKTRYKPIVDFAVYLVLRLVVCLLQTLTMEQCRVLAARIASLAYWADRVHTKVALDNLRLAFPGRYDEQQLRRLVWRVYYHFALVISEMAHIPRKLHAANYRKYVTLSGVKPFIEAVFRDETVMIVTGHFGNWEMAGYMFGLWGFRSYAVVRPLDNPHLDRFVRRFREGTGQVLIAKNGGSDHIREVLEQRGQIICFVADQDARRHGVFVEYFGRPASTHKAIALLALEYGATVMTGGAYRLGKEFFYEVSIRDVFRHEDIRDAPDPQLELTRRYTSSLERFVRLAPDQYLWLHRRWKTQPEEPFSQGPHKLPSRRPVE